MIQVFYSQFDLPLSSNSWSSLFQYLPLDIKKKCMNYRRWQDQHAFLLGRLLLMESLDKIGLKRNMVSNIKYNEYGKPFLNDEIDFTISHSDKFVVCAIAQKMKLGIDIESIKNIDFTDYKNIMSDKQWQKIVSSSNPKIAFYRFWTMRESVMKAEGKGLSIPFLDIEIINNQVIYDKNTWYLTELTLHKNICAYLATTAKNPAFSFFEADFTSGLKEIKVAQKEVNIIKNYIT
ncbi:4'-phosphopantetheinyl transferase family protein [Flavobacterium collinsii]